GIAVGLGDDLFLARLAGAVDHERACGHHASVFGAVVGRGGVAPRAAAAAYLYSTAELLVGAGLRLIPLGQLEGQRLPAAMPGRLRRPAAPAPAPARRGRGGEDRRRPVELQSGDRDRGYSPRDARLAAVPLMSVTPRPLKIGIGGPVGSGKTALAEALCRRLSSELDMAVITNDIYKNGDAEVLGVDGA